MSFSPIAFIAPNYRDYKNDWLKAYQPGTTTPKSMSLNSEATVLSLSLEVNKDGFLISAGGALVIPYINGDYDLWLFPSKAEADANDTANALRLADNINASTGVTGAGAIFAEETITLSAGQTTVAFSGLNASTSAVYIGGSLVDRGRLNLTVDYTVTGVSTIELTSSFPAGALCTMVSDETLTAQAVTTRSFETVALAAASASIKEKDALNIKEYIAGNGGGAMWDVALTADVTPNDLNVVISAGNPLLSLVLRIDSEIHSKQFGLAGDGITDDTSAIQALRDYMAANSNIELVFDEGTYLYSTSPNWAIAKLVVRALGIVTFRNTGTGDCLIFDDPVGTTFDITWCWDNPIFIEGDDNTGHGLYNRSVHHSKIAVNIRGCGLNAHRIEFAVVNEYNITVSINEGPFYSATAPLGVSITERNAGEEASANTWYNPIIEGVRGVGIFVDKALNNKFIGGTSEGNVGANIECSVDSRNNSFEGIDLEVSGSSQGFIDRGRWNKWLGIFNDANSTIAATAIGSTIRDGIHDAIVNTGAYTTIDKVSYGANGAEVTDTGTFTTITDAYDIQSATIKIPNKVQGKTKFTTTLTVGAFGVTALVPGNLTKSAIVLADVKSGDNVDLSSETAIPATFTKPTAVCVIDGQIDITFSQLNGVAASPLAAGGAFTITVNGK